MRSTGTIHSRKSMLLLLMTVMVSQETCFPNQNCCQRNLIKDTRDPQNMKKIIAGYISLRHRSWMCKICEKYLFSGLALKEVFSTRACEKTTHPSILATHPTHPCILST